MMAPYVQAFAACANRQPNTCAISWVACALLLVAILLCLARRLAGSDAISGKPTPDGLAREIRRIMDAGPGADDEWQEVGGPAGIRLLCKSLH
jgi:hypothetical protein